MIFDNNRFLMFLLKRAYLYFIAITLTAIFFAVFFAVKWVNATRTVYITGPDQTFIAYAGKETLVRSEHEVRLFARFFIERSFAHDNNSVENDLRMVMEWMDSMSAKILLLKFNAEMMSFYNELNSITKVEVKEIEVSRGDVGYAVEEEYTYTMSHQDPENPLSLVEKTIPGRVRFYVKSVNRSKNNPWGLLIYGFQFIDPKNTIK